MFRGKTRKVLFPGLVFCGENQQDIQQTGKRLEEEYFL